MPDQRCQVCPDDVIIGYDVDWLGSPGIGDIKIWK